MKNVFTIAIFLFSWGYQANALSDAEKNRLVANYKVCLTTVAQRSLSQITCSQKIDYKATMRKVKQVCDQDLDKYIRPANSQKEHTDIRDLKENNVFLANAVLDHQVSYKQGELRGECGLYKAIQKRKGSSDIHMGRPRATY